MVLPVDEYFRGKGEDFFKKGTEQLPKEQTVVPNRGTYILS